MLRSVADLDGPDALARYRVLKAAAKVTTESAASAEPPMTGVTKPRRQATRTPSS